MDSEVTIGIDGGLAAESWVRSVVDEKLMVLTTVAAGGSSCWGVGGDG